MRKKPKLSLIIPAYNEAPCLKQSILFIKDAVESFSNSYEIIIAEDGSSDGTHNVAKKINHSDPRVKIFHSTNKLGRGLALKRAWENVDGEIFLFIDADLATDMSYYPKLIELIKELDKKRLILINPNRYKDFIVDHFINRNGDNFKNKQLYEVEAKYIDNTIQLLWITESEVGNLGFELFKKEYNEISFSLLTSYL